MLKIIICVLIFSLLLCIVLIFLYRQRIASAQMSQVPFYFIQVCSDENNVKKSELYYCDDNQNISQYATIEGYGIKNVQLNTDKSALIGEAYCNNDLVMENFLLRYEIETEEIILVSIKDIEMLIDECFIEVIQGNRNDKSMFIAATGNDFSIYEYDFLTNEIERIGDAEKDWMCYQLVGKKIYYIDDTDGNIYQYDIESQTITCILDWENSIKDFSVSSDENNIIFKVESPESRYEKLYLYDVETQYGKYITQGWIFDDLAWIGDNFAYEQAYLGLLKDTNPTIKIGNCDIKEYIVFRSNGEKFTNGKYVIFNIP